MIGSMATRVSSPVLVGRSAELEQLVAALDRAAEGSPSTVLVAGEAGIGKTRLLREFIGRARATGAIVLEGACVGLGAEEGLPFAPIADALRAIRREIGPDDVAEVVGPAGPAIARLVPELGGAVDQSDVDDRPAWAQARLLEGILGVLQRLARRRTTVLVVEDLHWADRSTRDVLAFLARSARADRLLVVATYRSDELHRRHPLRPWLAEMDRLASLERVALERLGRGDLGRLLASITGVEPAGDLLETIAARSDGNPFYAEELLAAGAVRSQDPLPGDLRDVLLSRIGGLSDETREILGVAAVAGTSVEHDLLREAAGADDLAVEGAIREAVAAGLVVATTDGPNAVYGFRHALLQEAVYDDLLPTERRRHHLAFADALRRHPPTDGAAGASRQAALAHHASAAHDLPAALAAWIAAGRAGAAASAFSAAARSLERALDLWDAVSEDARPTDVDVVGLLAELALARQLAGETGGAVDAARSAVDRFDTSADPVRAAALRERLSRAAWVSGNQSLAFESIVEAVRLTEGLPASPVAATVRAGHAAMLMLSGLYRQAIDEAEIAIRIAGEAGAEVPALHAMSTLGVCLAQTGDCERGQSVGREGFERTLGITNVHDLGRAYANYATILEICGRPDEGAELSRQGSEWARRNGVWRTYGAFHDANLAGILVEHGRWQEALELLGTAEDAGLEGVTEMNHIIIGGPFAVRRGDLARAHALLDTGRLLAESMRDAQFSGPLTIGLAELALAEGRLEDAWAAVVAGVRILATTEDALIHAAVAALAARLGAERALAARDRRAPAEADAAIAAVREIVETAVTVLDRLPATSAAVVEPRAHLATADAELARATDGRDGGAADAWAIVASTWGELDRPYRRAYARYREGEAILARGGDRTAALAALTDARTIATRLGAAPLTAEISGLARRARLALAEAVAAEAPDAGAAAPDEPSPAVAPTVGAGEPALSAAAPAADPFGLTVREREVLALVAEGHTNRRIADELFISESTAGVHVSNILGKLGVASRTEAAAVAVRLGLIGERRVAGRD
jgi:DNA-binding CsgD family transcriptional regulator/tetratricopeptide (TPR) repeat protein